jgi:sigma-B regulation protein RsbU (phosphoserine phosphatase)
MERFWRSTVEQPNSALDERTLRVLIADDQGDVLLALRLLLRHRGFEVREACDPVSAMAAIREEQFDLVLLDLNYHRDTTSGREGLDLLCQIRNADPLVPLLVMTAWANTEIAIEAMRQGACDFVIKPWVNETLVDTISRHARRAAEARSRELRFAQQMDQVREIFRRFVPGEVAGAPGMEIAAGSENLDAVGGDYFEVLHQGGKTAICLGDVVGKGFSAAFLLSSLHAFAKPLLKQMLDPAEVCRRLNKSICELDLNGRFISLVYGVVDRESRRLSYSNAGHNPPILLRPDGVMELSCGGRILGFGGFGEAVYATETVQLRSGDRLVFYTDGISENRDSRGEEFGHARLIEAAAHHRTGSAKDLENAILDAARRHGNGRFEDDATVIAVTIE